MTSGQDQYRAFLANPAWSSRAAIAANVAAHVVAAGPAVLYRLIVPEIMSEYAVDSVEVGYLFSFSAVCTGICAILVGINARRMNFRRVCLAAVVVHIAGALTCILAPTFGIFLLGRAASACADGVLICAANAALARSDNPTRYWIYCAVAVGLTGAAANALIGRMIPLYGMDSAFAFVMLLGVFAFPAQFFIPGLRPPEGAIDDEAPSPRRHPIRAITTALRGPRGVLFMLMIVLFTTGSGMINPFDAVIGTEIGLSIVEIGDIRSIAFIAATLALFFGLWLGDRFGRALPFLATGLAIAASDGLVGTTQVAMVFAFAIVLGDAAHRLNGPYYASVLARHDRSGSLNGAAIAFVNVGSSLGPVLGGALHASTGSYSAVGISAMTLGLIGFGGMSLLAFSQERGRREEVQAA